MGKLEGASAVATLMAAFRTDLSPDSVGMYAEKLADIHAELLKLAVDSIIEHNKFFPAISEIRRAAAGIAGLLPPTPAEALAIIRNADVVRPVYRRDGSLAYVEREWAWPESMDPVKLDLIRDTLARVGEPCDQDGKAHFGWENGFQKTYEIAAESFTREALSGLAKALPPHAQKLLPEHA